MRQVAIISEAAKTDSKTAARLLERRFPKRWGIMKDGQEGISNVASLLTIVGNQAIQDDTIVDAHYEAIEYGLGVEHAVVQDSLLTAETR